MGCKGILKNTVFFLGLECPGLRVTGQMIMLILLLLLFAVIIPFGGNMVVRSNEMWRGVFVLLLAVAWVCRADSQVVPLWPDAVPGNVVSEDLEEAALRNNETRYSKVCQPTLEVFLPAQASQPCGAVMICPGGGYARLAYTHEGVWVAEELNKLGVAAAVLKYRLPDDQISSERNLRPLQDAQRGLQLLHEQAGAWGIDPTRIGIMGFSAGGHLAATASTHFNDVLVEGATVEQVKPDFSILVYPVISMTSELTHKGSRDRLIGSEASDAQVRYYSNEQQVTAEMSPVCLVHSADDRTVKVENSLCLFEALRAHKVPAELHVLDRGGHGYGLRPHADMNRWFKCLEGFLEGQGVLSK